MIKVTVNVPDEAVSFLQRRAASKGITVTDALCRVLGNQKYLNDVIASGGKVLIAKRDGSFREVLLP